MMKKIKIANGQGFWGDCIDAPRKLINYGKIDYLTLDYLAEVTLSIMQKQKLKNSEYGYAGDFVELIDGQINQLIKNNIKIITNAGGVNPEKCKEKILDIANKYNKKIKVAIVKGDDIFDKLDGYLKRGDTFNNLYTNEPINNIKNNIYSANVYIDSFCIAEALKLGADIVLCGRISDPGLVVGPCIYEFGWSRNDYDKLASSTVAGHIIECGAQCTGGNYSNWKEIDDFSEIGYPIVQIDESGDFSIIKPEGSGGLINRETVIEQILYELGNPKKYISPDVCVDFTSFTLSEEGNNCVHISGVKGTIPTNTYKVAITYFNGYKSSGQLTISSPNALEKAKIASKTIWSKLELSNAIFDKTSTEYIGVSSCHKDIVTIPKQINEVGLRVGVRGFDKSSISKFTKEISPLITAGPPGITGFSDGRPKIKEIIAFWPSLINKKHISTKVFI